MAGSGFNPQMLGNMGGGNPLMQMGGGNNFSGGLAQFLNGMFGNSGAPYEDAMKEMQKYFQMSQGYQNPFLQAGTNAIPQYQSWLGQMQDPSKFINNQMNNYQASPWSQFMQNQAMRAGQNAGSASGMTGSTPLMMQMQQNAGNIASGDMQNWLGNVLGINQQYGAGLNNMMGYGQHSADIMSQLAQMMGGQMGAGAFGQKQGENQDWSNTMGGLINMFL